MSNERRWEYAHKRWDAEIRKANAIKRTAAALGILVASIYLSVSTGIGDPLLVIVPGAIVYAVGGDRK